MPLLNCVQHGIAAEISFDGSGAKNTLTNEFMSELERCLDDLARRQDIVAVILRSAKDSFCSGMDFAEFEQAAAQGDDLGAIAERYMALLRRLRAIDKIVVARIEGPVSAGGVGIVAASDIVVADRRASFSLPEVIWGLVPSNVIPFLIRRVGFQTAYAMTLLARPLSAEEAHSHCLIDILSDDVNAEMRTLLQRARRLRPAHVGEVKSYFLRMWYSGDEHEKLAIDHLKGLLNRREVQENIRRFVTSGVFPWEYSPALSSSVD